MRGLCIFLALALSSPVHAQSTQSYAVQCQQNVGYISGFNCLTGDIIPVTVNGQDVTTYAPAECDHPALLPNGADSDGQCVPFSRVLDLSAGAMQVAVMCRQKHMRSADSVYFDEIDIVAHNSDTGATCWFQASAGDAAGLNALAVPSPTSDAPDSTGFWKPAAEVANANCGGCHDNDPFMYSPFIGQIWEKVPNDPLGPYFHVGPEYGFGSWPTAVFDLPNNTCTGCHRIGQGTPNWSASDAPGLPVGTCGQLAAWMTGVKTPPGSDSRASNYPGNHAMPPGTELNEAAWNAIHGNSLQQILTCCIDGNSNECPVTLPLGKEY